MTSLAALPTPNEKRVAVRVTPDALRHVRSGHPWIYDGSITSDSSGGSGDLAVVFDDKRKFAAIGLWDPDSPIRVKLLHRGRPVQVDEQFWTHKVHDARGLRDPLRNDDSTTAFREINGENDGFPGLILDRYGRVAVLKLYSAAWFPHLRTLVPLFVDALDLDTVVVRLSRAVQKGSPALSEGTTVVGTPPSGPVPFLEAGLRFEADVFEGQKTGHFLDQRDNRRAVGRLAHGKSVLDVFSCTGGFSVHAAAGGATSVTAVDIAPKAIAAAEHQLGLNASRTRRCAFDGVVGDAFEVMHTLADKGKRYDLIVVDPPSFAQRQTSVAAGVRSYMRLTELAIALANPGAMLMQASCSSRISANDFHRAVIDAGGDRLRITDRTGHAIDHPVAFAEGEYLKAIYAEVRP